MMHESGWLNISWLDISQTQICLCLCVGSWRFNTSQSTVSTDRRTGESEFAASFSKKDQLMQSVMNTGHGTRSQNYRTVHKATLSPWMET